MIVLQDFRTATRALSRSPLFTFTAVVSLAIGLGATTSVFTVVNAFFLRPVPGIEKQDELVNVGRAAVDGERSPRFSYPDYLDLRDRQQVFSSLAAYTDRGFNLDLGGNPTLMVGQVVSGNYFSVYGVEAAVGRLLSPADDTHPGAHPVVVLSHGLWQRRFGGDPAVVGSSVRLNGTPYTVIGVTEKGFIGTFLGFGSSLWIPLTMAGVAVPGTDLDDRNADLVELGGRLRQGVTADQARAGLGVISRQLDEAYRSDRLPYRLEAHPFTGFDEEVRIVIVALVAILSAVALLVLAIVCVNVANMQLARAATRWKEIAVRLALGAGRRRVIVHLLSESLLIALAGGVLGMLVTVWAVDLLRAFDPTLETAVPLVLDFRIDWQVLGFAFLSTLLAGLAFGLIPALQSSRPQLAPALHDADQGQRKSWLRSVFVVGQIALTLLLLISAGLFLRVLGRAAAIDPGFDAEGVVTAPVDTSLLRLSASEGQDEAAERADFYQRLTDRIAGAQGVGQVSLARRLPLAFGRSRTDLAFEGHEPPPGQDAFRVDFTAIAPGYFDILGIALVQGRDFSQFDDHGAPPVAIVNEALVRRFWPDRDPLGERFVRNGETVEVVGVAADSDIRRLGEEPLPYVYLPFSQAPSTRATLLVRPDERAAADPSWNWGTALRTEIRAFEPELPILLIRSLEQVISLSLLPQRIAGSAAGSLGAVALVLAILGIHGVVAYSVHQRTREFGVRVSLGARRGDIVRLVVGQGARLVGAGVGVGLIGSVLLAGLLKNQLAGVSPADPLTYVSIVLLLGGATLLASYFPARRAAAVEPVSSLRAE